MRLFAEADFDEIKRTFREVNMLTWFEEENFCRRKYRGISMYCANRFLQKSWKCCKNPRNYKDPRKSEIIA